jgi:hypothetical protein
MWPPMRVAGAPIRYFWGLRLHLIATLHGLPVGFTVSAAKADERQVLLDLLGTHPALVPSDPRRILITDKHYYGRRFEAELAHAGLTLPRRPRRGEPDRPGASVFKPLRQTIESVFDTLNGQLDLELHGGHSLGGVLILVLQRLLALTTAIRHNDHTGQTVRRSLRAHDH